MTNRLKYIPTISAFLVFIMAVGLLRLIHNQAYAPLILTLGLGGFIFTMGYWMFHALPKQKNIVTSVTLIIYACSMFGFSYLLVPFYYFLSKNLGMNSQITQLDASKKQMTQASDHIIPTHGVVTHYQKLPWKIVLYPKELDLKSNQITSQKLVLYNPMPYQKSARIKLNISPGKLSHFLHPVTAIHNSVITLKAQEHKVIKVDWMLTANSPKLKEATIHYAFFPIK